MKKILLSAFTACFLAFTVNAQLPDGSVAPDWTATDINGTSHNLYDILDQGKSVVMDVSATWCGPCWSYHTGGALETLWEEHGPDGTDDVRVFMFEADNSTTQADLEGTGGNTQGDWITGTGYPIIDDDQVNTPYAIGYYPTIYTICPSRILVETGQLQAGAHWDYIDNNCAAATENTDAGILSYIGDASTCSGGMYTPAVRIQNLSASGAAMTAADIVTYVNGTMANTYNWTGNLELYGIEDVTLPEVAVPGADFEVMVEISLNGDTGNDNNSATQNVGLASGGDNNLTLTIQLDDWPEETGWEIVDGSGTVIASRAIGYYNGQDVQMVEESIVTEVDCFTLRFFDQYGDGLNGSQWPAGTIDGYYELRDSQGTLLVEGGGTENFEENEDSFGVDQNISVEEISGLSFVNVFPNPANDNITVSFNIESDSQVSFEMFNMIGERVYVSPQQNFVGTNSVNIDVTSLSAGMYTLNLVVDGKYNTTKVSITK